MFDFGPDLRLGAGLRTLGPCPRHPSPKLQGSDDGDRQMVKVLSAVLTDGLAGVEAACAKALADGVYSADVVRARYSGGMAGVSHRWRRLSGERNQPGEPRMVKA